MEFKNKSFVASKELIEIKEEKPVIRSQKPVSRGQKPVSRSDIRDPS
jgi:hypothetical protein